MLRDERHEKILQRLNTQGYVSITELCDILYVSKATIRRDIMLLEEEQLLKRSYGGAITANKSTFRELPHSVRSNMNRHEKELIAQAALSYISEGDVIFLDSGTTIFQLAEKLGVFSHLLVLTNDLMTALYISSNTENKTIVIGGELDRSSSNCTGMLTLEMMKNFNVNKAFIGVDAVNMKSYFMCYNMNEVAVKQEMIKKSDQNFILCDNSKFQVSAFMTFSDFGPIDYVITDSGISAETEKWMRDLGVNVHIVTSQGINNSETSH